MRGVIRKVWHSLLHGARAIWRWWDLGNSIKAADLATKLAALLGVIVVANFFVVKPEVTWETVSFELIDLERVKTHYALRNNEVPADVMKAIEEYNLQSQALDSANPFLRYFIENSSEAVILGLASTISEPEREIARQAIQNSLRAVVRLIIRNTGQASADDVSIVSAPGFSIHEGYEYSFDLPPGAARIVQFSRHVETAESPLPFFGGSEAGEFGVFWQPSTLVDTTAVAQIGVVLFTVWLITMLKEIFFAGVRNAHD